MSRAARPDPGDASGPRDETLTGTGKEAVAAGEDQSPHGEKSSYHPAALAGGPLRVRVEFVVMDGPEGRALGRRQADIMRKVLGWISHHRNHIGP
jgi:hypothetical protein